MSHCVYISILTKHYSFQHCFVFLPSILKEPIFLNINVLEMNFIVHNIGHFKTSYMLKLFNLILNSFLGFFLQDFCKICITLTKSQINILKSIILYSTFH